MPLWVIKGLQAANGMWAILRELWLYMPKRQNRCSYFGVQAGNRKIRNTMQVTVDLSETNRNCVVQKVSERKILSSEHPVFAHGLVKYKQHLALRGAVCTTIFMTQERLCSLTE